MVNADIFVDVLLGPGKYVESEESRVGEQLKSKLGTDYEISIDGSCNSHLKAGPFNSEEDAVGYIGELQRRLGRMFLARIGDDDPRYRWSSTFVNQYK